ncbi:MAG TPA: hypothetical protein VGN31_18110 [Paraburkholderia sp.]|jgi:hypothetical protein
MNPTDQIIEKDITHLEHVVRMLSVAYRVDIRYWERRVEALKSQATVPSHLARLEHVALQIDRIRNGLAPEAG